MKNIRWIVIVAMVLVGLWSPMASPEIYPPQKDVPVNTASPGRYQIVMSPIARADTFLLDTVTGRIWRLEKYSELPGEPLAWTSMDRFDTNKAIVDWAERYKALTTEPRPIK